MVKMEVTVLFKRVIESTTTSLDVQNLDNIHLANKSLFVWTGQKCSIAIMKILEIRVFYSHFKGSFN